MKKTWFVSSAAEKRRLKTSRRERNLMGKVTESAVRQNDAIPTPAIGFIYGASK